MVPVDVEEYDRWHAAGVRALAAAASQQAEGFHEWACFLAEQAAQLAVKGLLHAVGAAAWGHDLVALVDQVDAEIGPPWPHEGRRLAERLSRFYLPTRYPDALPGGTPATRFGKADSAEALADARALITAVEGVWATLGGAP